MIPKEISQQHILDGIARVRSTGFEPQRESDDYDLWIEGNTLPPKVVISNSRYFWDGVEHPSTSFRGGRESNIFLIERGFPIVRKDSINPAQFFTPEELNFLDAKAGQPYDKNNPADRNAGLFLNQVIWEKCKAWADAICQSSDMVRTGGKSWNEQHNNATGQIFKTYAWYRVNPTTKPDNNVFYTVGIESRKTSVGAPQLVIKLDCRRNKLSHQEQQAFDALLSAHRVQCRLFSDNYLETGNWTDLVNKSVNYIQSTIHVYEEAIALFRPDLEQRFARMVWNTRGWVEPSGQTDKSENIEAHENSYGHGHEEWLFDTEKEIDGYVYGRLHAFAGTDLYTNRRFDLFLYTNKKSEGWKWVGRIKGAEGVSRQRSTEIAAMYLEKGWMEDRYDQLGSTEGADVDNYRSWPDDDLFNVRYKPEDLELYELQPFVDGEKPASARYSILMKDRPTPKFLDKDYGAVYPEADIRTGIDFNGNKPAPERSRLINRPQTTLYREIRNIHGEIQEGLVNFLRSVHGADNVDYETTKFGDNTRVDVVVRKTDGSYVFYEVKSYPSVRHSIRIAIGQLLEYAFLGCIQQSSDFVIVTHLPARQQEIDYLAVLSQQFGLSFTYMHFDRATAAPVESL